MCNNNSKRYSKYLQNILDETYLTPPDDIVTEGELPQEDFEVRNATIKIKFMADMVVSYGFLKRIFNAKDYKKCVISLVQAENELMELVNKTPIHQAAIRRIINNMPIDNGGRDTLKKYIK